MLDGPATRHNGVPEEVLAPPDPSKVGTGRGLSERTRDPRSERRRVGAKARQATAEQRRRVTQLEKDLEKAEAEVATLHAQLADPEVYDEPEEVHRLASAHEEAKDRAAKLMEDWTNAAEDLDSLA